MHTAKSLQKPELNKCSSVILMQMIRGNKPLRLFVDDFAIYYLLEIRRTSYLRIVRGPGMVITFAAWCGNCVFQWRLNELVESCECGCLLPHVAPRFQRHGSAGVLSLTPRDLHNIMPPSIRRREIMCIESLNKIAKL